MRDKLLNLAPSHKWKGGRVLRLLGTFEPTYSSFECVTLAHLSSTWKAAGFDLISKQEKVLSLVQVTVHTARPRGHMIQQIQWAWSVVANTDAVEKLCQSLKADSQQRPLGFWSKALSCSVDNYSSFERMKKKRKALGFLKLCFETDSYFLKWILVCYWDLLEAEWCKAY